MPDFIYRSFIIFLSAVFSATGISAQQSDTLKNEIKLSYTYTHFDQELGNWKLSVAEYKRITAIGPLIVRANHLSRPAMNGWQYEVDVYPKLSKRIYNYISAGYSNAKPVFPGFRAAYSVFMNFPQGWEAEGGFRYLYFEKNIWIYTAGVSKYAGSWLFNVRSFIAPSSSGTGKSFFVTARRFLKSEQGFVWLQAGQGTSPDENRNIQFVSRPDLGSLRINAGAKIPLGKRSDLYSELGWARNEMGEKKFNRQVYVSAGIARKF